MHMITTERGISALWRGALLRWETIPIQHHFYKQQSPCDWDTLSVHLIEDRQREALYSLLCPGGLLPEDG